MMAEKWPICKFSAFRAESAPERHRVNRKMWNIHKLVQSFLPKYSIKISFTFAGKVHYLVPKLEFRQTNPILGIRTFGRHNIMKPLSLWMASFSS